MPGLLPFRMGAFTLSAETGIPIVPVTIRGSRYMYRAESRFPRRGTLSVTVGKPLMPPGRSWGDALKLRDASRREILRHLGEPDLSHQTDAVVELMDQD